ncbi:MAG: mandelate racemase/muconate lactonizing enzyme family protein [Alphaproteobacteria bacterium]|nr:mandelate racemase/muconate lactonizing enzyme family protein [Alphaproteobacteria bacterium]
MRIESIRVYQVTLPLTHPYRLSGDRLLFEKLDSTIIAIDTDTGLTGWGEGCPWGSTYLPAFGGGLRAAIAEIAGYLIGRDPRHFDAIDRAMDSALPGHPYAKSPLDIACWDILGQSTGMAVCELLGGRTKTPVRLHSSVPTGTPEEMVAAMATAHTKGYRIHSPKVGGTDVELDVARIRALDENRAAGVSLTFDVNRAWLADTAIQVMNSVEDCRGHFEQPCETYAECLNVRRRTRQPIILDESIQTFADLVRAHTDQACELIGLKINRVGGLTKARRMRDFCVAVGLRMNIEETGGSVSADMGSLHLAHSTPETHRRATWMCHDMLTVDIAPGQGSRNIDGVAVAPNTPGIGVTPTEDLLGPVVAQFT